jgi:hypothetical protein
MLRTDRSRGHLESILLGADTKNGTLVALNALVDVNEGEAYTTKAIEADDSVVIVDAIAMDYVSNLLIADYTAPAGDVVRGRHWVKGDIFTIEQSQIPGYVGVGDKVEVTANGWEVGGTPVKTMVAKVIAEEDVEGLDCAVIRIDVE